MEDIAVSDKKNVNSVDKAALPFIISVTLVLGVLIGFIGTTLIGKVIQLTTNSSSQLTNDLYDQKKLDEVYSVLKEKYIGEIPTKEEITQGLTKGLIGSLEDEYTIYLPPSDAEKYTEARNPDFEGVGISLRFNGENTEVESVLKGYPAEKAGLKSGDIIIKVDDSDMLGKTAGEVASKVRGPKGSKVKVEVFRPENNSNPNLSFDLVRETIEIDNISYKKHENGVIEIDITQFVDVTPDQFNRSWDKVVSSIIQDNPNPKGIILDLRSNPGGFVYSLRYVMEEFFKDSSVLMKEQRNNSKEVVYVDNRVGKFENTPLMVLVNEGTASASEIFAIGVQDNKRGQVIGMETVGKGVEQEIVQFDDGSILIVVFQKWLSPNGKNITKESPVKPDIEVDYTERDVDANRDPQLNKAKELLLNATK